MLKYLNLTACLIALLPCVVFADAAKGEKLFGQCRACHQVGPDAKNQFGPVLNGVMARSAAQVPDYQYSSALTTAASKGLSWDEQSMHEFLEAPMTRIPGTKMAFMGVSDESDRSALIAYLNQFDTEGDDGSEDLSSKTQKPDVSNEPIKLAADFTIPAHGELHLGRVALPEEVSAWDIDIRPDGLGLPEGSGSALVGAELYEGQCAVCHGDFGEGIGRWPILAGGQGSLEEDRPEKTIGSYWPYLSTVYDYVRRAMPFGNARSLSDDDVYAITAYLLYLNDLVDEDFELNSENFNSIRLPNEQQFIPDNRTEEAFRQTTVESLCMQNCLEGPAVVTQRARVLDVTPEE